MKSGKKTTDASSKGTCLRPSSLKTEDIDSVDVRAVVRDVRSGKYRWKRDEDESLKAHNSKVGAD